MSVEIFRKYIDVIKEAENPLKEFAPGGEEGNSPYAYGMALKEMAQLYAEGEFDIELGASSAEQNESDANDINRVAEAFLNQGMEAGREAYQMVDDIIQDDMDSYLSEQGFNVDNDIHAEYQKDVERYRASPAGQAQASAQAKSQADWEKGEPERKANEVVISAVDAKTGIEEFSKITFDQQSVPPEQLQAQIQQSVAQLKKHFVDYPGRNPSEKIIRVSIGGKPVDV